MIKNLSTKVAVVVAAVALYDVVGASTTDTAVKAAVGSCCVVVSFAVFLAAAYIASTVAITASTVVFAAPLPVVTVITYSKFSIIYWYGCNSGNSE